MLWANNWLMYALKMTNFITDDEFTTTKQTSKIFHVLPQPDKHQLLHQNVEHSEC